MASLYPQLTGLSLLQPVISHLLLLPPGLTSFRHPRDWKPSVFPMTWRTPSTWARRVHRAFPPTHRGHDLANTWPLVSRMQIFFCIFVDPPFRSSLSLLLHSVSDHLSPVSCTRRVRTSGLGLQSPSMAMVALLLSLLASAPSYSFHVRNANPFRGTTNLKPYRRDSAAIAFRDVSFKDVRGSLYPTIGLKKPGITSTSSFGQHPFFSTTLTTT